jgi:hypothetical protein
MRLWSISPSYLDRQGLLGCWREALLAQHVLLGQTTGYKNHPQLDRFKKQENPVLAIGGYLWWLWVDATNRGYNFNKLAFQSGASIQQKIPVNKKQVLFEYSRLLNKLQIRSPKWVKEILPYEGNYIPLVELIALHPMFYLVDGEKESWEKG